MGNIEIINVTSPLRESYYNPLPKNIIDYQKISFDKFYYLDMKEIKKISNYDTKRL